MSTKTINPKLLRDTVRDVESLFNPAPATEHVALVTALLEADVSDLDLLWEYVWATARHCAPPHSIEDDQTHPWHLTESSANAALPPSELATQLPPRYWPLAESGDGPGLRYRRMAIRLLSLLPAPRSDAFKAFRADFSSKKGGDL